MVTQTFYYEAKTTPSYLKGLIDTRARADGQITRLEAVLEDVRGELEKARSQRDACDDLITRYNATLDPSRIAAVKAWKGHYGKKGALMEELADFVRRAHPATVSSRELATHLAAHFGLGFATPEAEFKWRRSRVRNILDRLKKRGLVTRVDVPGASHNTPSRWRWCVEQSADSMESLAALARELGVRVDEAAGEDEGP